MNLLNQILLFFRPCFTEPSFRTFICTIVGMIIRTDSRGMASFIRALCLAPPAYDSFEYFFKSSAANLKSINETWVAAVRGLAPFYTVSGMVVLIIDGVKVAKEGKKMAIVKKHHQDSENSSKADFMHGHLFGGVGVLVGHLGKLFSLPLSLKLNDGMKTVLSWEGAGFEAWRSESHVVQMIHQAFESAKLMGRDAVVLGDRYFPTVPLFKALDALNAAAAGFCVHMVGKMKKSAVAYEEAPPKTGKRGRPRIKGAAVKLSSLFEEKASEFVQAEAFLYGEKREVGYYVADLLWGSGYYKKFRFVLVTYEGAQSILISTKLDLSPVDILELYGLRFKIECGFRELKQVIDGFGYRFWNKNAPKLNKYKKKADPDPLASLTDERDRHNILKTIRAIELFALCGCIALGSLQLCSLKYSRSLNLRKVVYLRTYRGDFASEATMAEYLRGRFYCLLGKRTGLEIIEKIKSKQPVGNDVELSENRKAA